MAGRAVAPCPADWLRIWEHFQDRAESRIREGNVIAGEGVWEIAKPAGMATRLIIRSVHDPENFVECTLDPETRALVSRYGEISVLRFELAVPDAPHPGVEEALTAILDQLIWNDDADWQPGEGLE